MKTLRWHIDEERGTLGFDVGRVFTGNTYAVDLSGASEGACYTFSVLGEDAREMLAQSETDGDGNTVLALTSCLLRNAFRGRWHEQRTFHVVASDGASTVAEGDLVVEYMPAVADAETGRVVSMKGPPGVGVAGIEPDGTDADGNAKYLFVLTDGTRLPFSAPRGPAGADASANYAKDESTGLYHRLVVHKNAYGEKMVDLDQDGVQEIPSGDGEGEGDE